MARVKLENIARRFDGVTAIEDINLDIPDGEFWVLVGPSGCGKSTILRTIAGLETATAGKLYINGHSVEGIPARQRNIAMVFQNYALYPHMTVAENLAFGLRMRGADQKSIERRVWEVAKSLSIDGLLQRKPKQLSGGQQQRVALGRRGFFTGRTPLQSRCSITGGNENRTQTVASKIRDYHNLCHS
jgi:multiple sugar transport system ATP-binding protein